MILNNYIEQHENIRKELQVINDLLHSKSLEENAFEIASHINRLAGIINVHLSSEDKYFYPSLMSNKDPKVAKMAKEYQDEMGNLLDGFKLFKDHYNTKTKIVEGSHTFVKELKAIAVKLEQRMKKEETGIYKLID